MAKHLRRRNLADFYFPAGAEQIAGRIMFQEFVAGRSRGHIIHQGVISGLDEKTASDFYDWLVLEKSGKLRPRRKRKGRLLRRHGSWTWKSR